VLDENAVLEHRDLRPLASLADDHDPVHGFTPGEELGLGNDRRTPPPGFAAFPATLPLRLQPG